MLHELILLRRGIYLRIFPGYLSSIHPRAELVADSLSRGMTESLLSPTILEALLLQHQVWLG